jgi:ABC-type multidrug transport system fused ATPase/permease subunit
LGSLLPVLGLYALAALKLKPATNQIYSALSYLKFGAPSLKLILTELQRVESQEVHSLENNHERLKFKSALTLHNLSFKYDTSHLILKDIDMTIRAKTTVGIIGKTGAGKSTLIDLILGLLHPTSGEVLVDGEVLTKENVRSWQNAIGYVPQTIFLSDDTIANNIAFGIPREAIDQEQVIKVAKMAQIDSFIETLENGYHTEVGERGVRLSGGQRQRLGIARALYHKPDLLLLDEATSALDTQTEKALMESIDNMHGDITIVMIAHRLNTVEKCDMIIHLEDGRLKEE